MGAHTWNGAGANNNWSTPGNWDVGTVPATTDAVTFNNTSVKNCTIDNVATWSGGTFTVASTYTGIITCNVAITTAAFSQAAGTFTDNSGNTYSATTTSFSLTGGTYNAFSGTTNVANSLGANTFTGTFNANGGTFNWTGSTVSSSWNTAGKIFFNLVTINRTSGNISITGVGTTIPLGNNPTSTIKALLTMGTGSTITVSGIWSVIGGFDGSSVGTVSGALTDVQITTGVTRFRPTSTWPSGVNVQISFSDATAFTFLNNGKTFGTFKRTGTGTGTLTFNSAATFTGSFKDNDGSVAHTLTFTSGTTWIAASWLMAGVSTKLVTINASTPGSAATLHTTGGTVSCDFLNITDSTVDASPKWFAGANSTQGTNDTNWIFTAPTTVTSTYEIIARRRGRR